MSMAPLSNRPLCRGVANGGDTSPPSAWRSPSPGSCNKPSPPRLLRLLLLLLLLPTGDGGSIRSSSSRWAARTAAELAFGGSSDVCARRNLFREGLWLVGLPPCINGTVGVVESRAGGRPLGLSSSADGDEWRGEPAKRWERSQDRKGIKRKAGQRGPVSGWPDFV